MEANAQILGQKMLIVEDRLTSLPDNILHEILSLIPTMEAVRLSVLSAKWRYLWVSLPCLYISEHEFGDYMTYTMIWNMIYKFKIFVDKVFSLHDQSVNIRNFHLQCTGTYCISHLEAWISSVIAKNKLNELTLEVSSTYCFTFPCSLSQFSTLNSLKIHMFTILHIPVSVCLSRLRVLHLTSIRFSSGQSTEHVSISFPVLEECSMTYCYWLETQCVFLQAPSLKTLRIVEPKYPVDFSEIEINIDAQNLVSVVFCNLMHDYSISSVPSLLDASIDVVCGSNVHRLLKCMPKIYNVQDLALSYRCIETLSFAGILPGFQTFSKLIHLKVTGTNNSYFRGALMINLLCYMPNLESLVIDVYSEFFDDGGAYPHCVLSKLKNAEIKYLKGTANELNFVAYLLARTLEKMNIFTYHLHGREKQEVIFKLLHTLPRGSPGTELIIS